MNRAGGIKGAVKQLWSSTGSPELHKLILPPVTKAWVRKSVHNYLNFYAEMSFSPSR